MVKRRGFVDSSCIGGESGRSSDRVTSSTELSAVEGVPDAAVDGVRKSAGCGLRGICSLALLPMKPSLLVESAE
jgi:hypothetical protein